MGQYALPTLRYDPPPNFYRSASTPPEQYSSTTVNAYLVVYPFRPDPASLLQAYQQTMLRNWIDPQYQETNVAGPPGIATGTMPGADTTIVWSFVETIAGLSRPHLRVAILSRGAVAIVDLSANSEYSWQQAWPAMQVTLASMRVVMPSGVAAAPQASPATHTLAGVYMGMKGHYVVDLNRPVGSGTWQRVPHFYLFSADGRVYRGFNLLVTSTSELGRFDFDAAERTDPESSGRFTVQGDQLLIQFGGPVPETVTTALPQGGRLTIDAVTYVRQ
jgi:hypothetical protein